MKYRAEIKIMPLKALLDPQGKAIAASMKNLNMHEVSNVRVGKHINLDIDTNDPEQARSIAETACKKLLANPIMEYYEFQIFEIDD